MTGSRAKVTMRLNFRNIKRKHPKIVHRLLNDIGEDWADKAADVIDDEGHNFTKSLRNHLDYGIESTKTGYRLAGTIPANIQHGETIHEGRRKGARMPPREPIADWVEKKLGIKRYGGTDGESIERSEFKSAVYNIRRSIAKNGLKSLPAGGLQFFWTPLKQNYKRWLRIFGKQYERLMKKAV